MAKNLRVTFLGSSSGGGPSESRNCSSLVADVLCDGTLWMVDAGEGTLRQFALQPQGRYQLRVNNVKKIFVTHMHADHTMGLITILRNVLMPPPQDVTDSSADFLSRRPAKIELFGPAGLRAFVRTILKMTHTNTADRYVVHELLTSHDPITPCDPPDVRHSSENVGRDILCDNDGYWRSFTSARGKYSEVQVDAGPIVHRDPCLGYVMREVSAPHRKLVLLGDTSDPSSIAPLAASPSLLVHEATDAYIPASVDPKAKRSVEVVKAKTLSRGHSTPIMAGEFARSIGARRLILNHIGGRFPAPRYHNGRDMRSAVMREIERQASEAWTMGQARAACDYMQVSIPPEEQEAPIS